MRVNPYYNNDTMNIKQLSIDLEKQGLTCRISKDCDTLIIDYFKCYLDFIEISLTGFKDWRVLYYEPSKGVRTYSASTNWSVIKLLRKLLIDEK